jgi:hypothetical protein
MAIITIENNNMHICNEGEGIKEQELGLVCGRDMASAIAIAVRPGHFGYRTVFSIRRSSALRVQIPSPSILT